MVTFGMNTTIAKTFEEESRSFFLLYLMNLAFAALTMAGGLTIVIQQLVPGAGASPAGLPGIPVAATLLIGGIAFVLGLVWIASTARIMKSVKVVRTAYRQRKKQEMSPEDVTGLMVRLMTQYREQKPVIRVMVVVAMTGGIWNLLLGISNLISVISSGLSGMPSDPAAVLISPFLASAFNLVIGAFCIRVSLGFRRYAKVWDERLDALARSEEELGRMLERT